METATASLKLQFDLHTRLFNNATAGISDDESHSRHSEQVNHMKWIAGHLLNTRLTGMSRVAGLQPDETYSAQFARGVSLDPGASYPPFEEITSKWKEVAAAIGAGISKIPEGVLATKTTVKAPIEDDTIRGLLSFLISHEAYHIGQLGILRKTIGKEPMSYA